MRTTRPSPSSTSCRHTLVLPKAPARNLLDVSPADLAHVMTVAQKIAKAALAAFEADGITIQQFNEGAGGQVVFHTHVHVIPRHEGVSLRRHTGQMADQDDLKAWAEKWRSALG